MADHFVGNGSTGGAATSRRSSIRQQIQWAGQTPCYPGIGVSVWHGGVNRVVEQINITRLCKTGGFVVFEYGVPESKELLPMLGLGITKKPQSL